jgi:hypothetical protein
VHRGFPLLVGLKSEISISSEIWFGASVNSLVTFTWSSETSSVDSGEISQVPLPKVVVSTCDATLHSKGAHKTILLHTKIAIQHSFNILLTYQSERSELNLGRVLRGQLIRISYLLRVTTEPIGNNGI